MIENDIYYLVVFSNDLIEFVAECDLRVKEGFVPTGGIAVNGDTYYQSFYQLRN
jgi:hypothetical protein